MPTPSGAIDLSPIHGILKELSAALLGRIAQLPPTSNREVLMMVADAVVQEDTVRARLGLGNKESAALKPLHDILTMLSPAVLGRIAEIPSTSAPGVLMMVADAVVQEETVRGIVQSQRLNALPSNKL